MEAGWFILDSRKVVFLDRDGVINRRPKPHCYVTVWEEFDILPGVYEAICKLNKAGYYIVVVSNQRGIARGICSRKQIDSLHKKMLEDFKRKGAVIDKIYICPHEEGVCSCRKPKPGLLYMAEAELWNEKKERVDRNGSWMIGDSKSDMKAGQAYGVKTIWIHALENEIQVKAEYKAKSLYEAVEMILQNK